MVDSTAPTVTLNGAQAIVLEAGAPWVDPGATAADNCSGDITSAIVTESNVNLNVPGEYVVRYGVTDASGNIGYIERNVTVIQSQRLTIQSVTPSKTVLASMNYKMIPIDLAVVTSDPTAEAQITSVTCNQSVDVNGSGKTAEDCAITGPLSVNLRAERTGKGTAPRIYTITIEVVNAIGTEATTTVDVIIPHDQRK